MRLEVRTEECRAVVWFKRQGNTLPFQVSSDPHSEEKKKKAESQI
jgi:hypothetical protein